MGNPESGRSDVQRVRTVDGDTLTTDADSAVEENVQAINGWEQEILWAHSKPSRSAIGSNAAVIDLQINLLAEPEMTTGRSPRGLALVVHRHGQERY